MIDLSYLTSLSFAGKKMEFKNRNWGQFHLELTDKEYHKGSRSYHILTRESPGLFPGTSISSPSGIKGGDRASHSEDIRMPLFSTGEKPVRSSPAARSNSSSTPSSRTSGRILWRGSQDKRISFLSCPSFFLSERGAGLGTKIRNRRGRGTKD